MTATGESLTPQLCTSERENQQHATNGRRLRLFLAASACGPLLLMGLAASASAQAILSPNKLMFDCRSGHPCKSQTTTLTNEGSATLTISSIAITGTSAGKFSQTSSCGAELKAGASCTISVGTTPMPKGKLTGALIVNDSAPNSPQKCLLEVLGS